MTSDKNNAAIISFANCAGVAREENCNPEKLGEALANHINCDHIVAVGISEVIVSVKSLPKCQWSISTELESFYHSEVKHIDDLETFQKGFERTNEKETKRYYLSHLNSRDFSHPEAIEKKWAGSNAPKRIVNEYNKSRDIYQGTGVLLYSKCQFVEGLQLRVPGKYPLSDMTNDPNVYLGTRDTEPRGAIILHRLRLIDDLEVNIAFCQLETNSDDIRIETNEKKDKRPGINHRIAQIKRLADHLIKYNDDRPIIIMGDFNARPGTKELNYLCDKYGFKHILPDKTCGKDNLYNPDNVDSLKYTKSEKEQGWPYSHLKHEILIDHAFIKGFDQKEYGFGLDVIKLQNEDNPDDRYSDHRPIVLTITKV